LALVRLPLDAAVRPPPERRAELRRDAEPLDAAFVAGTIVSFGIAAVRPVPARPR